MSKFRMSVEFPTNRDTVLKVSTDWEGWITVHEKDIDDDAEYGKPCLELSDDTAQALIEMITQVIK